MIIRHEDDYTHITFGKLSDPGVIEKSPIYQDDKNIDYFTSQNFQYIVDNIVDMYGYKQGTVSASVNENDYEIVDAPKHFSNILAFRFTMNAEINTFLRTSYYGKHFMYAAAEKLGYPVVFGIVAHEIGHLVTHNTLNIMNVKIANGNPELFITQSVNAYWDELCADYLAGVTLSKAVPDMSEEPLCCLLEGSEGGAKHPDGYWRTIAIRMGYQWGRNNSPMLTDTILSKSETQKQLLVSFQKNYFKRVYLNAPLSKRVGKTALPADLYEDTNVFLGYL